jgi:hypothetical protein
MVALLLNAIVLGGLIVLLGAAIGALREAIQLKARPRGVLFVAGVALLSLLLLWAVLI